MSRLQALGKLKAPAARPAPESVRRRAAAMRKKIAGGGEEGRAVLRELFPNNIRLAPEERSSSVGFL